MKTRVYLETTIISYLTARPSRDLVRAAQQELTREWWETRRDRFRLFVSQFVLDEAGGGDMDASALRLRALDGLPALQATEDVVEVGAALISKNTLPRKAATDAVHIALAAVHGIDILLTWNCRHLANPHKAPEIADVIRSFGYIPPVICTPFEIMEKNYGE